METVLTMMLIRFGLIALVVVALGLAAFAVVLVLRRAGRGDAARSGAVSLTRTVSRLVAERLDRPGGEQGPGPRAGGQR
ncbi:MAG: hypothetical protein L0I76_04620 [Pseudonocardia sp.]|nr:hypothetical protein [Pseudonocardia sp.]